MSTYFRNEGLYSVEFIPQRQLTCGFQKSKTFPPFFVVLQNANNWLLDHPEYEVRTCETFIVRKNLNIPLRNRRSRNSTVKFGPGNGRLTQIYIRALRLWLQPKTFSTTIADQIGYFNITPKTKPGLWSGLRNQSLAKLVKKANETLRFSASSGKLLNVESLKIKYEGSFTEPDTSAWKEGPYTSRLFVTLLRVFYIKGPSRFEEFAIMDFPPELIRPASRHRLTSFETFPQVFTRVTDWMNSMPLDANLVNVNTLLIPQRRLHKVDVEKANADTGSPSTAETFVRVVRVVYCFKNPEETMVKRVGGVPQLNCVLFVPAMLGNGQFEDGVELRTRMSQWIGKVGINVLTVETVEHGCVAGADYVGGLDDMSSVKVEGERGTRNRKRVYLNMYRVFFEGNYTEHEDLLPQIAEE